MREFLEETKITHIDLIFKYWPGNFFYTITSNLNLRGLKRILCHLVINKRRSHGEKKGRKLDVYKMKKILNKIKK